MFNNNIYAQYRIILDNTIKPEYFFIVPFIASYEENAVLGTLLFSNPYKLLTEVLFPHGTFEIAAGILSTSLYYSLVVNLIVSMIRKNLQSLKIVLIRSLVQTIIIVYLYLVAAILEGLSISYKLNITHWL